MSEGNEENSIAGQGGQVNEGNRENDRERIIIYDTTLRDGEQAPKFGMNAEGKLEIAHGLASMGVDIIEAGFPGSSPGDWEAVHQIAKEVHGPVISGLARCVEYDVKAAGEALKPAIDRGQGKIHVFVATSDIHVKDKLRKTREQVIEMAVKGVRMARSYTPRVEFSCEDFGRSDLDYIVEVAKAAIDAGADTINLPDTVGYMVVKEETERISYVIRGIGSVGKGIIFSVHNHDDLGLSTATTLAAIEAGARQVEVTMNGIGERAGNTSLEQVVAALKVRSDYYGRFYTGIDTRQIGPMSRLVSTITGQKPQLNSPIVGENAFGHAAGIHQDGMLKSQKAYEIMRPEDYGVERRFPLTARSGKNQVVQTLKERGISFDDADLEGIMERYKALADKRREVHDDDLVQAVRGDSQVPAYFSLKSFSAGKYPEGAFAEVEMNVDGKVKKSTKSGKGMIEASEKAINELTGLDLDISRYDARSATSGAGSKGIEIIVARNNGFTVMGQGMDDDTVTGAAKALVDASNRMKYVMDYAAAGRG
ncbi:2-isopropylmalate synthase [Candidatus Woesearchaeota archaeon]|nr:2-isopropylmalate synthase [Candidatus Woesearchaeota archaeon]